MPSTVPCSPKLGRTSIMCGQWNVVMWRCLLAGRLVDLLASQQAADNLKHAGTNSLLHAHGVSVMHTRRPCSTRHGHTCPHVICCMYLPYNCTLHIVSVKWLSTASTTIIHNEGTMKGALHVCAWQAHMPRLSVARMIRRSSRPSQCSHGMTWQAVIQARA